MSLLVKAVIRGLSCRNDLVLVDHAWSVPKIMDLFRKRFFFKCQDRNISFAVKQQVLRDIIKFK